MHDLPTKSPQGSHDEVYTDGSKMNERLGAAVSPFPEWWDNLPPTVQKIARQQHHLCSWGYIHQSGTELLPTHGPSPSRCGSLLWLNVLFAGNWGWRHREPFYLPYHELALVIEGKGTRVRFRWVPSHCGIEGNERVDQLTRETLNQDKDPLTDVHYTDMKYW